MRVDWTGQILVSESASSENHIARAIDSVTSTANAYHHTKVTVEAGVQNQSVPLSITTAYVLYIKVTDADGAMKTARLELDGLDVSITTGDVLCSEMLLFNTDIVAMTVSNEGATTIYVEVVAAGV